MARRTASAARAAGVSPVSNHKRAVIAPEDETRVLIATGAFGSQNLQDCAVVVNYDLPWTIIRLIQRAGRVDRIGQTSDRVRLRQNAEVVGPMRRSLRMTKTARSSIFN